MFSALLDYFKNMSFLDIACLSGAYILSVIFISCVVLKHNILKYIACVYSLATIFAIVVVYLIDAISNDSNCFIKTPSVIVLLVLAVALFIISLMKIIYSRFYQNDDNDYYFKYKEDREKNDNAIDFFSDNFEDDKTITDKDIVRSSTFFEKKNVDENNANNIDVVDENENDTNQEALAENHDDEDIEENEENKEQVEHDNNQILIGEANTDDNKESNNDDEDNHKSTELMVIPQEEQKLETKLEVQPQQESFTKKEANEDVLNKLVLIEQRMNEFEKSIIQQKKDELERLDEKLKKQKLLYDELTRNGPRDNYRYDNGKKYRQIIARENRKNMQFKELLRQAHEERRKLEIEARNITEKQKQQLQQSFALEKQKLEYEKQNIENEKQKVLLEIEHYKNIDQEKVIRINQLEEKIIEQNKRLQLLELEREQLENKIQNEINENKVLKQEITAKFDDEIKAKEDELKAWEEKNRIAEEENRKVKYDYEKELQPEHKYSELVEDGNSIFYENEEMLSNNVEDLNLKNEDYSVYDMNNMLTNSVNSRETSFASRATNDKSSFGVENNSLSIVANNNQDQNTGLIVSDNINSLSETILSQVDTKISSYKEEVSNEFKSVRSDVDNLRKDVQQAVDKIGSLFDLMTTTLQKKTNE